MRYLFLVIFLSIHLAASATNYYFSSVTGDDSRSQQQAQNPLTPWKTNDKLNAIFGILKGRDSILFKRGETFPGSIVVKRSGNSNLPIVFASYCSGEKPVITGFKTPTSLNASAPGV